MTYDMKFIGKLSSRDLDRLVRIALSERVSRLIDDCDPDLLARRALEGGFSPSGDPIDPQVVAPGIIAMTGVVKDLSANKHRCTLFTVKLSIDDLEETWAWDDGAGTFLVSETAKVGGIRKTVSLHTPPDGAIILRHEMTHDGNYHTRKSVKSWVVEIDYDIELDQPITKLHVSDMNMTRLPPPNIRDV